MFNFLRKYRNTINSLVFATSIYTSSIFGINALANTPNVEDNLETKADSVLVSEEIGNKDVEIDRKSLQLNYRKILFNITRDNVINTEDVVKLNNAIEGYLGLFENNLEKDIKKKDSNVNEGTVFDTADILEESIFSYYPTKLPEGNITYQADECLSRRLNKQQLELVDSLLVENNRSLLEQYKDDRLSSLVEKDSLDIGDLVLFYNVVNENYSLEHNPFLENLRKYNEIYKSHLGNSKRVEEYQERWRKFWNIYTVVDGIDRHDIFKGFRTSGESLLKIIEEQGYENINIPKPEEEFPAKTKWPWYASLPIGLFAPFIIRTLINSYVGKRGYYFYDGFDASECIFSPFLGHLFIDSIHPYAFFVRLGLPIFFEGIRSLDNKYG